MDPLLLADHVNIVKHERILDIGTGCGIMPLLLLYKHPEIKITGVEIQENLADIARKNIKINNMDKRSLILLKDIKDVTISDINVKADIIIANPPYKKKETGRINPDIQKAIARHEIKLTLETLIDSVKRLLAQNGRFYIIYPAERVAELICSLNNHEINPEMIKFVHTKKENSAKLVILMGAQNSAQPLKVLSPLFVHKHFLCLT